MKLLLLMAGGDDLFKAAGYQYPKNLTQLGDSSVVEVVLSSLKSLWARAKLIALIRRDEIARFHTDDVVRLLVPNATVVEVPDRTGGAACTALLAIDHIVDNEPVIVINGDQILDINYESMLAHFDHEKFDAGTVVFSDVHPRWSFVRCNAEGLVVEAAEKRPISRHATAGVYWFRNGKFLADAIMSSILKGASHDGAFFICPVLNEMILWQNRVGVYQIEKNQYWSLSTPESLRRVEESQLFQKGLKHAR